MLRSTKIFAGIHALLEGVRRDRGLVLIMSFPMISWLIPQAADEWRTTDRKFAPILWRGGCYIAGPFAPVTAG